MKTRIQGIFLILAGFIITQFLFLVLPEVNTGFKVAIIFSFILPVSAFYEGTLMLINKKGSKDINKGG